LGIQLLRALVCLVFWSSKQGGQIGQIFACRAMVNFGQFFRKFQNYKNFELHFSRGKSYVLILTKMDWATFWAIFHKRIWSPWFHDKNTT
jgi:hypothetical protein